MENEARRAVVAALIGLAGSSDYRDRADAGRGLAPFAEMAEAREPLLRLLLDAGDTFVTRATAEALLRREDSAGFTVVAAALAAADAGQGEWIGTAVLDVFGVFAGARDAAVRECEALRRGADDQVHHGAGELMDMLAVIDPVLRPAAP
ncbi:hypothetical protein ACWEOE_32305 [Amycolatopsis sp. NPDC004368]